jgi:hypothetical protein
MADVVIAATGDPPYYLAVITVERTEADDGYFEMADVDSLFELNSDPEVMRYINGGKPTPREEIRDNIIP